MKIFIIKGILLILLAGAVLVGIRSQFPYDVGNRGFHLKKENMMANIEAYNTAFIGSSRILRQVDPQVIDKQVPDMRSYNLGVEGTFYPEGWYLAWHLVNELDSGDLEYLVVELAPINYTIEKNLHTVRGTYFLDDPTMQLVSDFLDDSQEDAQAIAEARDLYSIAAWDQRLANGVLFYKYLPLDGDGTYGLGADRAGFAPFLKPPGYLRDSSSQSDFKQRFNRQMNLYMGQLQQAMEAGNAPNASFLQNLQNLVEQAAAKGITIYWLVPPMNYSAEVYPLFDPLGQDQVISFLSRLDYPRLYKVKFWQDRLHYTSEGAKLFSKQLGIQLKKRIRRANKEMESASSDESLEESTDTDP